MLTRMMHAPNMDVRRATALVAIAILCQSLAGCGRPTSSYQELMKEGLTEYDSGGYAEAIAMFKNASEADRERPEPSYYVGMCYMKMADRQFREDDLPGALRYCDRAHGAFEAAVGAFPGYARAMQGKADALKLKGENQAALRVANWAAAYVGPQAKMLILKGRQYAQAGDIDNAQLAFKQAVSIEDGSPAAHAELGLFYMRCGNRAKAIEHLQRAYDLNPGAPDVLAALAKLGATPRVQPK
ncbi:MAG: tetratricopeptide repeat protein [Planctomycetota bacterium]